MQEQLPTLYSYHEQLFDIYIAHQTRSPPCPANVGIEASDDDTTPQYDPLDVREICGILVMCGALFALSVLVFAYEVFLLYRLKRQRRAAVLATDLNEIDQQDFDHVVKVHSARRILSTDLPIEHEQRVVAEIKRSGTRKLVMRRNDTTSPDWADSVSIVSAGTFV